jgi:hypothetical protein
MPAIIPGQKILRSIVYAVTYDAAVTLTFGPPPLIKAGSLAFGWQTAIGKLHFLNQAHGRIFPEGPNPDTIYYWLENGVTLDIALDQIDTPAGSAIIRNGQPVSPANGSGYFELTQP